MKQETRMKKDVQMIKSDTRSLPVKLREDELRERGDALASVIQDVNAEESRQVDVKAQLKARLSELEAKKTQLAIVISRREEFRDVLTETWHDYGRGVVYVLRTDTKEEIGSRGMTNEERQPRLAGVAP